MIVHSKSKQENAFAHKLLAEDGAVSQQKMPRYSWLVRNSRN